MNHRNFLFILFFHLVTILSAQNKSPDPKGLHNFDSVFSITGVGDIMLGTNFPSPEYLAPDDGKYLLAPVSKFLKESDITFANLEGGLLDSGDLVKKCKDTMVCYAFRSPERYAHYLADAGIDMVSLANNHSGDFGIHGRMRTMIALDSAGIKYSGLLSQPICKIERYGFLIGMAAFSPNVGTWDINSLDSARMLVSQLAAEVDIVIVSFHGGAEGSRFNRVTRQPEIYYEEERGNVYEFAHAVVDAGADIVFGHGPHVTRAMELYNDRLICYSLGNFCTYGRFNLKGENGIAPAVKAFVDTEGKFIYGMILPVKQIGEGGPVIDFERKVLTSLSTLTKLDFPETKLEIGMDMFIRKIK